MTNQSTIVDWNPMSPTALQPKINQHKVSFMLVYYGEYISQNKYKTNTKVIIPTHPRKQLLFHIDKKGINNYFILRELPLLFLIVCKCKILFLVIYNVFWWSDPIQDVIVNSFGFTVSTSSFVCLFSTPHIYWFVKTKNCIRFFFLSELVLWIYWWQWINSFHLIR